VAEENDGEFLSEEKSAAGTEGMPSSNDQNKPVTDPQMPCTLWTDIYDHWNQRR
jgi:hypothetical protein